MNNRPLNVGLIGGGGAGAFIVHPHVRAICMDGTRRVSCGALRSKKDSSLEAAAAWPFPIKGYSDFAEMIRGEAARPVGERMDYALIVTPNHAHFAPAKKCLEEGIPVFCEKPLTLSVAEGEELEVIANEKNIPFSVAHTYLGHWTSRLARHIITSDLLGKVRWVDSSYLQGWLAGTDGDDGQQAAWRIDPARAGISNCGGDIGTHAFIQLCYVTGLKVSALSARLERFVEGRSLDDHFTVYCELSNGGRGLVRASQVAIGHKNDLRLEVNGSKGSLLWRQEEPETLTVSLPGQPDRVYWRGEVSAHDGFLGELPAELMADSTLPSGHGEAFHDAFARLHRDFEADVRAWQQGSFHGHDGSRYATVSDGVAGMRFVAAAVRSSEGGGLRVELE